MIIIPTRSWLSVQMVLARRDVKDERTEELLSATINVHLIQAWANYGSGAESPPLNLKKLCSFSGSNTVAVFYLFFSVFHNCFNKELNTV